MELSTQKTKMHYFDTFCIIPWKIANWKNPSNFLNCQESKKVSEIFLILENLKKSNCMQTVKTNNPIVWQTKSNCMQTVKTNNPIGWQTVKTNNPIGWQTKLKKKKKKKKKSEM